MWPLLLGFAALGFGGYYLSRRKDRQQDEDHVALLHEMAAPLGGTVLTRGHADGWSAALWPPFEMTTRGLARLAVRRKPRFDVAVEFTRGPWRVRISEASIRRRTTGPGHTSTSYEHRIDIVTADLPPLRVTEQRDADFMGRPADPNNDPAPGDGSLLTEAPATVVQRQGHWVRAAISAPANQHLTAFTSDHAAAARMLNAQATSWLLDRQRTWPRMYTFESGLLYTTAPGRIDPFEVTATVNTMLGFLDCIPGAAPAGSTAESTPARSSTDAASARSAVEDENHLIAEPAPSTADNEDGESDGGDEEKSSVMSKLGIAGIVVASLALLLGLLGYGSVALINGVAMATGLSQDVEVRIVGESDWKSRRQTSITEKYIGEYTLDGRAHQVGVASGEVGDVIEGQLPALPIDWLGFHDTEPTTDSNWWVPYLYILAGVVCFGLLVGPIWLAQSEGQGPPSAAQGPPAGNPSMRPE
ncbi:hypothetical protein GCM10009676_32150 [Prauserella halophila]|uniref:DUF3068 family protein n=2 Tax=Prauserella halophila TaxID=185641 RepID=A0ABP4GYM3_9PSEU